MLKRLAFAFVALLIGAMLLRDEVSRSDTTQTTKVIGGAVLFSLGLMTLTLVAKGLWKWRSGRKYYRNADRSVPD
jgi:uncharacterized membrane protein